MRTYTMSLGAGARLFSIDHSFFRADCATNGSVQKRPDSCRCRAYHADEDAESLRAKRKGLARMPLLQILIVLIVVGFLLWLVNHLIPMQNTIKSILNAVVIICVALWLLNVFGVLHSISRIRIGH